MITELGGAKLCSRAARLGASPMTSFSDAHPEPTVSPTTTNPVAMPTRTRSLSPGIGSSAATASTTFSPA